MGFPLFATKFKIAYQSELIIRGENEGEILGGVRDKMGVRSGLDYTMAKSLLA